MKEGAFVYRSRQIKEGIRELAQDATHSDALAIYGVSAAAVIGGTNHSIAGKLFEAGVIGFAVFSGRRARKREREEELNRLDLQMLRGENERLRRRLGNK